MKNNNSNKRRRILIVDDDPFYRESLELFLSGHELEVESADDGVSAFSKFEQFNPDLVLSDFDMPGLDGYGLCKKIRESSNCPVLLLSGTTPTREHIEAARAAGVLEYVIKGMEPEKLLARIEIALGDSAPTEQTSAEPEPEPEQVSGGRIVIMLLGDQEEIRNAEPFLAKAGFTTVSSTGVAELLTRAIRLKPVCVITDDMKAILALRRERRTSKIPTVLIFETSPSTNWNSVKSVGATEAIARPFRPDGIAQTLDKIVQLETDRVARTESAPLPKPRAKRRRITRIHKSPAGRRAS